MGKVKKKKSRSLGILGARPMYWLALLGVGGVAIWYFWPKPAPKPVTTVKPPESDMGMKTIESWLTPGGLLAPTLTPPEADQTRAGVAVEPDTAAPLAARYIQCKGLSEPQLTKCKNAVDSVNR